MRRALAITLTASLLAGSCGDDDASACTEVREAEDPASTRHVTTPEGYRYLTDPPTSGPHIAGPVPEGVVERPIVAPIQVRILESGGAVVQYDPAAIDVAEVEVLAVDGVVVAPGENLPAPVVVTAWIWKLTCDAVDPARIQQFVVERPAGAPGAD